MKKEILIIGSGGQGIKTMGEIIGLAAHQSGLEAACHSLYTPAMRGGSCISSVVYANHPIDFPMVQKADMIFVLNDAISSETTEHMGPGTNIFYLDRPRNLPAGPAWEVHLQTPELRPFDNMVFLGVISRFLNEVPGSYFLSIIKQKMGPANMGKFRTGRNINIS